MPFAFPSLSRPCALCLLLATMLFSALALSGSGRAQSDALEPIRLEANDIKAAAAILQRLSSIAGSDDESLVGARVKYQNLLTETTDLLRQIDEQSKATTDRLAEIGPPPPDDSVAEPSSVVETRAQLNSDRAALAVLKTDLEAILRQSQDAIASITQTRQQVFTEQISRRTPLDSEVFSEALPGIVSLSATARSQFVNWFSFLATEKPWQAIGTAFISLALALFLSVNLNRFFGSYIDRQAPKPDYFTRVFTAFWASILPSLATAIFLATAFTLSNSFGLLPSRVARILFSLFIAIGGLVFAWNFCRAVFAPSRPPWRLAPLTNPSARQLFVLTLMLCAIYAFDLVFTEFNAALSGPLALTALQGLIASLAIGVILFLIGFSIQFERHDADVPKPAGTVEGQARQGVSAPPAAGSVPGVLFARLMAQGRSLKLVRALFFLSAVVIILAALLGYIGFARFLAQQIVVSGAIIAAMIVGFQAARELSREGVLASTRFGQLLISRGIEPYRVEQLSLIGGMVFIFFVLTAGIPAILLQWGTRTEEITAFFARLFTGFDIGNIRVSLSGILFGVAIFSIVVLMTGLLQRWLTRSVFTRSKIDAGVSDSIRAGVGYFGYALAALLAVTSAGFDLSSLAIVAGALSLGIGFGLQNIVNNFVSGLILLVERPIKVGDWIVVGGAEGTVRRISVRATEIETFQRKSIIVPNSELINSQVGNWTFKSKSGRVDIPVGVAYGSDVRRVERILYELADNHAMVMKRPEPRVYFIGFGDFSLDFRFQMFLHDINNCMIVETEMRFAIIERFEEAGIEIPFPQRNIVLKVDGGGEAIGEDARRQIAERITDVLAEEDGAPVKAPRKRAAKSVTRKATAKK
ncbi:MAG: mechanosensitive ion channel family protein [Nitratireductor sp.]|nr:mechanosensitive ion channel family protein [Nitratireductor sp.]